MSRPPIPRHGTSSTSRLRAVLLALFAISVAAAAVVGLTGISAVSATDPGTVRIYPPNTIPADPAEDDSQAVELGIQFKVSEPGAVVGLRFYKSTQNTGYHVGSIWTSSGERIVEATFADESDSGWQTVTFASPVTLQPGVTYVASYHTTSGYYASQEDTFDSGATLGNDVITGFKGVYQYGAGGFPTSSWHNSAYFVDVIFKPVDASPTTALTTTSTPPTEVTGSAAPTTSTASASPTSSKPTAFPDASNTGVPAGTSLTKRGSIRITAAGTVLQNTEVDGCITLGPAADNVVIRNVLVKSDGCLWLILNDEGAKNLTVVDSELDGLDNTSGDAAIAGYNYTLTRVNIHGTVDGGKLGDNVLIQDSYIHDLAITSTSHNDGFQSLGSVNVTIRHNTIVLARGATSAVILSTGSADQIRDVQIDGNLLGGGAYTVYGGYQAGVDDASKVSGISITNNEFTTVTFPSSGAYGPLTSADPPAVSVSGNTWYDGPNAGKPVNS